MSIYHHGSEKAAGYHSGNAIQMVYHFGKLAWELIVGFLFTDDGYALKTEDDYIIKCDDQ